MEEHLTDIITQFAAGRLDDAELVDALAALRDEASDEHNDELAGRIGELVERVEMMRFSLCAAERRGAILELLPTPADRVRRWLEEAVIGLNLCPFARSVYVGEQVRIATSDAAGFEAAIDATLDEVDRLLGASPDDVATTLVVFASALDDFDEFLDAVGLVEALLDEAGASGVLQLAHFHPDYQFEGADEDAVENYTNRAPYPIIHLLREAQVSEAVDSHPDPESIPERNIEKLHELGRARIREMWQRWSIE